MQPEFTYNHFSQKVQTHRLAKQAAALQSSQSPSGVWRLSQPIALVTGVSVTSTTGIANF